MKGKNRPLPILGRLEDELPGGGYSTGLEAGIVLFYRNPPFTFPVLCNNTVDTFRMVLVYYV